MPKRLIFVGPLLSDKLAGCEIYANSDSQILQVVYNGPITRSNDIVDMMNYIMIDNRAVGSYSIIFDFEQVENVSISPFNVGSTMHKWISFMRVMHKNGLVIVVSREQGLKNHLTPVLDLIGAAVESFMRAETIEKAIEAIAVFRETH